jgi:hypothetical protein
MNGECGLRDTQLLCHNEAANPVVHQITIDLFAEVGTGILQPFQNLKLLLIG